MLKWSRNKLDPVGFDPKAGNNLNVIKLAYSEYEPDKKF
jgi:hypothetical protein